MTTLEDLRKANLKEQRGGATPVIAKPEPVHEKVIKVELPETPLISDLTEHGLTIEPKLEPVPTAPVPTSKIVVATAPKQPVSEPVAKISATVAPDPLVEKIRAAVLKKRLIPAGVKATVDMSPELFWRAKKYCHDHSNSTLRQLMLETLTQFLDEEGY